MCLNLDVYTLFKKGIYQVIGLGRDHQSDPCGHEGLGKFSIFAISGSG